MKKYKVTFRDGSSVIVNAKDVNVKDSYWVLKYVKPDTENKISAGYYVGEGAPSNSPTANHTVKFKSLTEAKQAIKELEEDYYLPTPRGILQAVQIN